MAKNKKRELNEDAVIEVAIRDHPEWRLAWESGDLPDEMTGEDGPNLLARMRTK